MYVNQEPIDPLEGDKQLLLSTGANFSENEIKPLRGIVSERKYEAIQNLYNEYIGLVKAHQQVTKDGYIVYSAQGNKEISNKLEEINLVLSLK